MVRGEETKEGTFPPYTTQCPDLVVNEDILPIFLFLSRYSVVDYFSDFTDSAILAKIVS